MIRAYQMTGNDRRVFHSATLAPLAQVHNGNEAFTGSSHFGVWGWCFEASRGSWTVSWDDDRTQEFALGASSTKTRT